MNFSLTLLCATVTLAVASAPAADQTSDFVGWTRPGHVLLPTGQELTPTGTQVDLPKLRPQALALSPNGKILVTSGKTRELLVIDPLTGTTLQTVPLPLEGTEQEHTAPVSTHILKPDKDEQLSFTGLVFSPDGSRVYLSNVKGSVKIFSVSTNNEVCGIGSIPLPHADAPRRNEEIPAGLAVSKDGTRLYVALNLSNRLLEWDLQARKVRRIFDVGALPYAVVVTGTKAYVSNWGGRRPDADSVTGPAGRGTTVRVDPVRYIVTEGSVSVVDLETGVVMKEILTGVHASGLALTPNERHVLVPNAGSDTVTVIDTRTDTVVEQIPLAWHPGDLFGASPNAIATDATGRTLYVCNGTQNAVAVIALQANAKWLGIVPRKWFGASASTLRGLIPTGWFPGAIVHDHFRDRLYVANIKGAAPIHDSLSAKPLKFNSHEYRGSLSLLPAPTAAELKKDTKIVLENYRRAVIEHAFLPPRLGEHPRPVPERTSEPSVFKHVIYIIKENRTYDQVLGDIKEGNGDPTLCVFGEKETPNQHKLARDFVLLDNTYCSGICSADGHQWATTAFATDYMEKSFADFPRSYPDGMEEDDIDSMAYAPSGFLWDNALAHGKTFRDYGEFTMGVTSWKNPANTKKLQFLDYYNDFVDGTGLINIGSVPAIASVGSHMMTNTIGWNMNVPDIFRAAQFKKELQQFEHAGKMPELIIICLPNDHTSGTSPGSPTPGAQVADNDLAFGQIVEAISHSSFWKETCIFAIEDDPQDGWDHVSGYRTTAYVISPYTKRHSVISRNYNHPGMIRTMELILGLPPMNQIDAAANPMTECFMEQPDLTPFNAVANNVPLDQMNPQTRAINDSRVRAFAQASARLPLQKPDQCPEDLLNRILWCAQKGPDAPYPEWAVTKVQDND